MRLIPIGIQRALRHPDYKQYIKGQTIFIVGFWLRVTALSWFVYVLTGSSVYLGIVNAISLLPAIVFGPFAGTISDKIPKRDILFITQVINLVSTIVMAILILTDYVTIWHVLVLTFLFGIAQAVGVPARNAFVVDLVGRKDLPNAVAMNSSAFNVGALLGPALAGLLIPLIGVGGIFAFNILSESYALFSISKIKMRGLPDDKVGKDRGTFLEACRYIYTEKTILYALSMLAVSAFILAPVNVLLPVIASEVLHGESTLYGMLGATMGVGALIGAIGLASRTKREGLVRWLARGSNFLGIFLFIFAFVDTISIALVLLLLIGLASILQNVSINTVVQFCAPHNFAGRIMSVHSMTLRGMGTIGSIYAGYSSDLFGIANTLIISASMLLLACIFILPKLVKHSKKFSI